MQGPVLVAVWERLGCGVFSASCVAVSNAATPRKSASYRRLLLTFAQGELALGIISDPFQDRMGPKPRNLHRSLALGPFNFGRDRPTLIARVPVSRIESVLHTRLLPT